MKQLTNRRSFLTNSAKATAAIVVANSILPNISSAAYSFSNWTHQQPLPYAYNSLEPFIDAATMEIHYSKHAAAYTKNLKDAILTEKVDINIGMHGLLKNISKYSAKMRNNGGGHFNHEFFWASMTNPQTTMPLNIAAAIAKNFNSIEAFINNFSDAAKNRFGSGWAWLLKANDGSLIISSTPNQDNPLMDVAEVKGIPLLGIDVWEHAYYLKYQNKRADYIAAFMKIINWNVVEQRFLEQ